MDGPRGKNVGLHNRVRRPVGRGRVGRAENRMLHGHGVDGGVDALDVYGTGQPVGHTYVEQCASRIC